MDFRQPVQSDPQIREERREDGERHPDLQVLRAYHGHALSPAEADRIQEHLGACPGCGRLFLRLVRFLEWDLDPQRLPVDDLARSWESFLDDRRAQAKAGAEDLRPSLRG